MKRHTSWAAVIIALASTTISACGSHAQQSAIPNPQAPSVETRGVTQQPIVTRTIMPGPGPAVRACPAAGPGIMRCYALVRTDLPRIADIHPANAFGYGPSDFQTAYDLTSASASDGAGETVAVVDAFVDPHPSDDLKVYRSAMGLPACLVSTGCLTIKAFGTVVSPPDDDWTLEVSLDVDMVSAICPKCKILLVEATNDNEGPLVTAEKYAVAHANAVSNSWGGSETTPVAADDDAFSSATVAITASTGDSGYNSPAQWPAILPTVLGVGGTSLIQTSPRKEEGWAGAGSGCSIYYAKPTFQKGSPHTHCSMRAQSDTSASADPNYPAAVYDSYDGGWFSVGGTSESSPITAAVFALVGNTATNNPAYVYAHSSSLNDITTGPTNGPCGAPICKPG
ncbi:MAG TPA: S8 family serine peptidase, partial [Candidatus Eremiobacteraceae bacterium]|nr:S8 family serine peptidase [Candidatus Eremiobacteraceae bacterium]